MTVKAIICYENHLQSALVSSITATSERTDFNHVNAYDWRTTTYWSPTSSTGVKTLTAIFSSAVSADYFALYRHNLGTVAGTVKLEYSTDSGSTWHDAFAAITPTVNQCIIKTFTAQTATYWRVSFDMSSADDLYVGMIAFGTKLTLFRDMIGGFIVPRHGRNNQIINSKTEGGQFAGRSIVARGAKSNITFRTVTQAWVRASWEPFVIHAELKPFFFNWNNTDYPDDACLCWTDGDLPDTPINQDKYHDINLPVQCLLSGQGTVS